MIDSLEDLVAQTRRLSRPRTGPSVEEPARRRKASHLPTAADSGGLPAARSVEQAAPERQERAGLLEDFTMFGERISQLMAEAEARRSQRKRCSPFMSSGDGQVILKPSRPRSRRGRNRPRPPSPDGAAGGLAALGIAILAILAIATVILSSPSRKPGSRAVSRQALPPATPGAPGETMEPLPRAEIAAGARSEPGG